MPNDEVIMTDIDSFIRYLHRNGETDIKKIADSLHIGEANAQHFAKVLEREHKVRITHKMGRIFVSPVIPKEHSESKEKGK